MAAVSDCCSVMAKQPNFQSKLLFSRAIACRPQPAAGTLTGAPTDPLPASML